MPRTTCVICGKSLADDPDHIQEDTCHTCSEKFRHRRSAKREERQASDTPRYQRLAEIATALERLVYDLDALQIGDVKGRVSPIKHALRAAIAEPVSQLRDLAQSEYQESLQ